jgi:uncharacterized membrane protein
VPVDAATSSQVAGRIHPRVIDLVAALATGGVGAFALVRADISDTLPGVAIAISLVPPLAVVGLTLESGKPHQASGALLLFLTNVAAILLTGLCVMALYRVRRVAISEQRAHRVDTRLATLIVVVAIIGLAVPLVATSRQLTSEEMREADVSSVADSWATAHSWEIVAVDTTGSTVLVRAIGPTPIPRPETFRAALDKHGLQSVSVHLELDPVEQANLPGQ